VSRHDKERYAADPVYRAKKNTAHKKWEQANRPKVNARRRERYANDPKAALAARKGWLKRAYGLTLEQYDVMVQRQNGLCMLCRRRPIEGLCVDHCHVVEMLRSLLCRRCNAGLGKFDDNPNLLRGGADYLDIWRIIHATLRAAGAKPLPRNPSKRKKRKETTSPPTSSPTKKPKPRK
jgi:Recombination endonuclease VII